MIPTAMRTLRGSDHVKSMTPACYEGPEFWPIQRAAQFPDRATLHQKAERHDQGRALYGCEDVEPERRRYEAEGKSGKPGDKRSGEGGKQKQRNFVGDPIHGSLHTKASSACMGSPT